VIRRNIITYIIATEGKLKKKKDPRTGVEARDRDGTKTHAERVYSRGEFAEAGKGGGKKKETTNKVGQMASKS